MKKILSLFILALSLVSCSSCKKGEETSSTTATVPVVTEQIDWRDGNLLDVEATIAEAAQSQKVILIYFYSKGCPFCTQMDETFKDQEIAKMVNSGFIPIKINGDINSDFVDEFEIDRYPTYWFGKVRTDDNGDPDPSESAMAKLSGYYKPAEFKKILDLALAAL